MEPQIVGIALLVIGSAFLGWTLLTSRKISANHKPLALPSKVVDLADNQEAILVIQPGGRVIFANPLAREWFGLRSGPTNLEGLVRRVNPVDRFITLCSLEGQGRFMLGEQYVEGISHRLPFSSNGKFDQVMVLSLKRLHTIGIETGTGDSDEALTILAELNQTMTASLELDETIQAILNSVVKLIPCDKASLVVLDSTSDIFTSYYLGSLVDKEHQLEKTSHSHAFEGSLEGYLTAQKAPVIIEDIQLQQDLTRNLEKTPFRSYMSTPLWAEKEFLGSLIFASLTPAAFTDVALRTLKFLSGQAGISLQNAIRHQEAQRQVAEFSGLAALAQSGTALTDAEEIFEKLVNQIGSLLDVEISGFLIYDSDRGLLKPQHPFLGIPSQFFELLHITISPGSEAEALFHSREVINASNAVEDPRLKCLGLDVVSVAASIQQTVLLPLPAISQLLGYLQVGNKRDGSPFNQDDLRLLTMIANQAATIIENASLVSQTHKRAQRAEALRRIASLTGSNATLDEILSFSMRELARLLGADLGMIYLLDENRGELRLHRESVFGKVPDELGRLARIFVADPLYQFTITSNQKIYNNFSISIDNPVPLAYQTWIETMQIQSIIGVPLIIRERASGEVILCSQTADKFDTSDLTLVSTTAGQLASAVEKSTLLHLTDEDLHRRIDQLQAINRISREINTTQELPRLFDLILDELKRICQADCGQIAMLDLEESLGGQPRIVYSTGEAIEHGLSEYAMAVYHQGEPRLVQNFQLAGEVDENLLTVPAPHTGIRSMLVVPVRLQDQVVGLIELHSRSAEGFDDTSLEITQSLAVQAAIAVWNALRYRDQYQRSELLSRRVETLEKLLETSRALHPDQTLNLSLEAVAYGIQESTPFNIVIIGVYEPYTQYLNWATGAGMPLESLAGLSTTPRLWSEIEAELRPEFQFGNAFFVPYDHKPIRLPDVHRPADPFYQSAQAVLETTWQLDDALLIPLKGKEDQNLGLISVDAPRDDLRPDRVTLEALEVFASQAALMIESSRKVTDLRKQVTLIQEELKGAWEQAETARAMLPDLLDKDQKRAVEINDLNQRVSRARLSLDIAEIVNRQASRAEVILALAQEMLVRLDMSTIIVAEPSAGGPRLSLTLGNLQPGTTIDTFLGQRNPLRACLQTGEVFLVADVDASEDWQNNPLLQVLKSQSFVCVPIAVDNQVDFAILATSQSVLPPFSPEDEQVFILMARQIAIALKNLNLLTETNRRLREVNLLLEFSRQIGTLDPEGILNTLVDSVKQLIPMAETGYVALWNPELGQLVNQAASGFINNQAMLEINFLPDETIIGKAFSANRPVCIDEVDFAKDFSLPTDHLLHYRDAMGGRLSVSSLVVPIQAGDNKLGVLALDNYTISAAFTDEDQALAGSLAHQTALTLENARLYQASENRALQLQALTQVAATITSSLQTSELISSLLDQVKSILPYETGTLWLRKGERLTIRAASGFEDSEERVGLSVAIEDSLLLREMITTSQPISVSDVRQDDRFPALIEHRFLSWLGVPLLSKGEVIGVIALEKTEASFYTAEHISAMVTFASQVAVALENAALYEESVRRTVELDQRSQRLALLNRLSSELSGSLDLTHILTVTAREMARALFCSSVSVVLFDVFNMAVLHAEHPRSALDLPQPLPYSPIFERLRESLGIFSTEDVDREVDLLPLREFLRERGTRALVMIPLVTGTNLHGVVIVQTNQMYRFSPEEVELGRTIANQASVVVQNAQLFTETERLFSETQQRSVELATLFDLGVSMSQVLDQHLLMETVYDKVLQLFKADSILLVTVAENDDLIIEGLDLGERKGPLKVTRSGDSFSEYILTSGEPLRIKDIESERETLPVPGTIMGIPARSWMGVPLVVRGAVVGVLSVQSYQPYVFKEAHLRLLSQVANQLAVALDNARLFNTVQDYATNLERNVSERTEQLAREHRRSQALLSIITELSSSLDMDLVLNRTLAVINDTIGAEHSLIMLVKPDEPQLHLRAALGYPSQTPKGGQPSTMGRKEGLVGWVINNREPALIAELQDDSRWIIQDDETRQHHSAMAVPLMLGEETLGALLLFHHLPDQFSEDQLELVQATAKQIAVAINNSQLFDLIRDQAERLGDMLRTQHVESSRSQAILEAVADGVLVTDVKKEIALFNASAESILSLDRRQVMGRSLEHFIGVFGKAGQSWMKTIQAWSENPASFNSGETYSEQIELDNRRVVSVHLSSVRMRDSFLGTVSIFRDISHQVEVDRLKSEFVATVSHELRTPMTSIKGYVEILLMGAAGVLNDQQTHFLEIVKLNTERLAILVNDLLDISRIEAGRITLSLVPLDLREIAERSLAEIRRRAKAEYRSMSFRLDAPASLPLAQGDVERVQQIIENLLENSYQYTPENGHIRLRVRHIGQELKVDVEDDGIGIPLEAQAHVFERFYRGEDPLVLASSGTGLGLSIVQRLVEMHHGRIWLESSGVPGKGSVFSFTLPVYPSGPM